MAFPAHAMADGQLLMAHLRPRERTYLHDVEEFRRYTSNTLTRPAEVEARSAKILVAGYAVERGERFEGA